jgi:rubrerythrin
MNDENEFWVCTECGYSSTRRFVKDICPRCGMTYWHCSVCGFTLIGTVAPDVCPECQAAREFINISCYIPGWREADVSYP